MVESEASTRKSRKWIIIHNDKVTDYSALTAHTVEEYPTETDPADYALFVEGKLLGNLDISWLKDEILEDPNSLTEPQHLVADAITELGACVDELQLILDEIEAEGVE